MREFFHHGVTEFMYESSKFENGINSRPNLYNLKSKSDKYERRKHTCLLVKDDELTLKILQQFHCMRYDHKELRLRTTQHRIMASRNVGRFLSYRIGQHLSPSLLKFWKVFKKYNYIHTRYIITPDLKMYKSLIKLI